MSAAARQGVLAAQRALLIAAGVDASLASSGSRQLRLPKLACTANAFVMPPPSGIAHPPVLLLLHGWGAGLGAWAFSLSALSKTFAVYCVDLPGMGAHDRCHFPAIADGVDSSIDFFLTHLDETYAALENSDETFRNASEKHCCGHSLGALIATYWELKRPGRFQSLVLASPAGVPEPPPEFALRIRSPLMRRLAHSLWESDSISPQAVMRVLPSSFVLRNLTRYYVRAFGYRYSEQTTTGLAEYMYAISTAGTRSSEMAFCTLLMPGAFARRPIGPLMHLVETPTLLCYGDRDWMDASAGERAYKSIKSRSRHVITSGADHNLMISEPTKFASLVASFCLDMNEQ
jgi:pimeloyl-ACP methyl ester carboxylesterase